MISGFEVVDISHLPQLPATLRNENIRILAARPIPIIEKPRRPRRGGTRLSEVIAEWTETPLGASGMAEGRQWVASNLYANESNSLQALRLRLGLSQGELAVRIGTTQARVSIYERGVEKPEFDMLMRLRDALSVTLDQLADAIEHARKRKEVSHD